MLRRPLCVAAFLLLLAASPALAQEPAEPAEFDWRSARLSGDVSLQDVTFEEAARIVGSRVGANPFVNWPMLELAGVARDTPVSLSLPGGTPGSVALRLLVNHVSQATGERLGVAFEEGTATVSTRDDLRRNVQTIVLDVRDLLPPGERRGNVAEQLIGLIRAEVEPEMWRENGGPLGAISEINGQLVFTGTPLMIEQAQTLLDELRPADD